MGYRATDGFALKNGDVDPTFKVLNVNVTDSDRRDPVFTKIGPLLSTAGGFAVRPRVDPADPNSSVMGAAVRFGNLVKSDKQIMSDFRNFVKEFVRVEFTPLSSETDLSIETWLDSTGYSQSRKEDLVRKYSAIENDSGAYDLETHAKIKSFIKEEGYDEFKHSRVINSRSDEWKVIVGPVCKAIEKEVFKHPAFIKKIPVVDRPQYIIDRLGIEGRKAMTDFTSYEGSFTAEFMDSCEMQLYKWMLTALPDFLFVRLKRVMGLNKISSKRFCIHIMAKRMSGEMTTSLGNGFSTLMVLLFLCKRKNSRIIPVIEGDDSLSTIIGDFPSEGDFASLGLKCKLELHDDLSTTSFCGLLFDEISKDVVVNPLKVLAEVGIGQTKYIGCGVKMRRALLRAKALSLIAQYPQCPIVRVLADKLLALTSGVNVRKTVFTGMTVWQREEYFLNQRTGKAPPMDIKMGSRVLVEKLFGISVNDQFHIERTLSVNFETISSPFLQIYVPEIWLTYARHYAVAGKGRGPHDFHADNTTFKVEGVGQPSVRPLI